MKQMLKIELERAFKGTGFKISILIGMVISVLQFVKCVVPAAMNPLYVLKGRTIEIPSNINNIWMAMNPNVYYELYIRLLPIIVVIPYAITYYTDNKKGIVKNYYSRTKKINYIIAKYIAVFLTGGVTATIPLIINLMAASAVLPAIIAPIDSMPCNANGMWSYIYFTHPYIYYVMYLILQFICAGLLATISLIVSLYVNNAFIVLLFPAVLCEFMNAVTGWSHYRVIKGMVPWRMFSINQIAVNYWQSYVLYILIILILGAVMYVWRGVKNDIV